MEQLYIENESQLLPLTHTTRTSLLRQGPLFEKKQNWLLEQINRSEYYHPQTGKLKLLLSVAQQSPSVNNLAQLGKYLDQVNRFEEAVAVFEQVLLFTHLSDEARYEIYKQLGNAYLKLSDYDSAQENYHKAFTLNSNCPILHINLGTLAIQKNEWFQVQQYFRESLRLDKKQDKGWTGLAIYHQYMGDLDLAIANLKKALDLNPGNRVALLLLVNWSKQSDQKPEKISRLIKYLESHSQDFEISLLLIQIASEMQQYALAWLEASKLVFYEPKNQYYNELYSETKRILDENNKS